MISYNYKIIRNENDEDRVYKPNIDREIPPLTYIEGPNSSGKSTLLNILGLAFQGLRRKDINPNLKSKMESLINMKHQKIEFNFKIDDHGKELEMRKDFDKNSIITRLDGDLMSREKIVEKYNLIYDIPENPIDRLSKLIASIKTNQEGIYNKLYNLIIYLQEELKKIDNSYNPEVISELEKKNDDLKIKIKNKNKKLIDEKKRLRVIEKYYYLHWYRNYLSKMNNNEKRIEEIDKNKKIKKRKINKERKKIMEKCEVYFFKCSENKENITTDIRKLIVDEPDLIKLWSDIDYYSAQKENKIPGRFIKVLKKIKRKFEEIKKIISKSEKDKYHMWMQIIEILEKSDDLNAEIPGLSKRINKFIEDLKKQINKLGNKMKKINLADKNIELINQLIYDTEELKANLIPELISINKKYGVTSSNIEVFSKDKLTENNEKYTILLAKYKEKCLGVGIDINDSGVRNKIKEDFDMLREEGYHERLSEKKSEVFLEDTRKRIENLEYEIKKIENLVSHNQKRIEEMNKSAKHEYYNRREEVEKIIEICISLQQKLVKYNSIIDSINEGKTNIEKTEKDYFQFVFQYLGNKIGSIRHVNKSYDIESVDVIEKKIITKSNKIIKFSDMGTGQSQSAYLMGKLNSLGSKKAIVLIDEIAMMDKKSLNPIFNKLDELYNQEKILLAIVVQKGEKLIIKKLQEVL